MGVMHYPGGLVEISLQSTTIFRGYALAKLAEALGYKPDSSPGIIIGIFR